MRLVFLFVLGWWLGMFTHNHIDGHDTQKQSKTIAQVLMLTVAVVTAVVVLGVIGSGIVFVWGH